MMIEDIANRAYQQFAQTGGATVNLQGIEPTSGYAYGGYVELEKVLPPNAVTPESILQYMQDNEQALAMPNHYLGIWHDQESGNVFLDVSIVSPPGDDALKDAKDRGQIAVWDIGRGVEIPTGGTLDRNITSRAGMAPEAHQQVLDANRGQNLQGLPGPVNVPGAGRLQFHSHGDIQRVANEYNQANGLGEHPGDYVKVNPQYGARIAQEYEAMQHDPHNPQVAQAYDALKREAMAQYHHAVKNGYQFEFYPERDPYPNSPREAVLDLHHNKHMYVYPTEQGYGMSDDPQDHPLLADSGVRWNGRPVTHNDLFRAVHDFYGHAKEGLGFRADGEDNAYRQHSAMFSEPARKALASETRGQNSWVNYGPHGEHNQTATHDTIYAPQKAGLMPDWTTHEGLHRTASWTFKQSSVIETGSDRGKIPGLTINERPFLFTNDHVYLGPPGSEHYDISKHLGLDTSGYEGGEKDGLDDSHYRPGILDEQMGEVYAYPRMHQNMPATLESAISQLSAHLNRPLKMRQNEWQDMFGEPDEWVGRHWDEVRGDLEGDIDHRAHSYTRGAKRLNLTNETNGRLSWELPEGYGLLGPQSLEEHALMSQPHSDPYVTCPGCGAYTKMPLGSCPHCGMIDYEPRLGSERFVSTLRLCCFDGPCDKHKDERPWIPDDLDSQDNGISTEADPTAIEPEPDEVWRWEDEGGSVKDTVKRQAVTELAPNMWPLPQCRRCKGLQSLDTANCPECHGTGYARPDMREVYPSERMPWRDKLEIPLRDMRREPGHPLWNEQQFLASRPYWQGVDKGWTKCPAQCDGGFVTSHPSPNLSSKPFLPLLNAPARPSTQARTHEAGQELTLTAPELTLTELTLTPSAELAHSLGLDTWDTVNEVYGDSAGGYSESRPSRKEFLTSNGIREPIKSAAEGWNFFSNNPEGTYSWKPGEHGKGIIDRSGQVHAWTVDEQDGFPSHADVQEHNGIQGQAYFHITPEGLADVSQSGGIPYPQIEKYLHRELPIAAVSDEMDWGQAFSKIGSGVDGWFHVAPTTERARIQTHGLQPASPALNDRWFEPIYDHTTGENSGSEAPYWATKQPVGVYVEPTPEDAYKRWATDPDTAKIEPQKWDVWHIPSEQVKNTAMDRVTGGEVITHPVFPTLHEGPEHRLGHSEYPGYDVSRGNESQDDWNYSAPTSSTIRSPYGTDVPVVQVNTPSAMGHEGSTPVIYRHDLGKAWIGSIGSTHAQLIRHVPELTHDPYRGDRPSGVFHGALDENEGTPYWYGQDNDNEKGWEAFAKTATIIYPTGTSVLHDWRHLAEQYPDNDYHGTEDYPYFWDLKKNEVHLGPLNWYHDDLGREMGKTEHGNPFGMPDGKWYKDRWAIGRTSNYRRLHKPVFDALEDKGIHVIDQGWENTFSKVADWNGAKHGLPDIIESREKGSMFDEDGDFFGPDKTGTRPVVYHQPSNTVFIGLKGQHHPDVVREHGLHDENTIGWVSPPNIEPLEWTSMELSMPHMKHLNYGMVEPLHGGGYGLTTWGQFPDHAVEALKRADYTYDPSENWEERFAKAPYGNLPQDIPNVVKVINGGQAITHAYHAQPETETRPWEPGQHGKAVFRTTPQGHEFHVWQVDEEGGWPHHGSIGRGHRHMLDTVGQSPGFEVAPNGSVNKIYDTGYDALIPHPFKLHEDIDTWSQFAKVAKETPNQIQRKWESLNVEHPNSARVIHNLSNGWTIQQLGTSHDVTRVGKMMHNCWRGLAALTPKRFDQDSSYHTMNDERGIPRVAFKVVHPHAEFNMTWEPEHGEPVKGPILHVQRPLGRNNKRLEPWHADLFREWAQAKNLPLAISGSGQPSHFDHPTSQLQWFSGKGSVFDDPNLGELEETDPMGNRFDAKVAQVQEIPYRPEDDDWEEPSERPYLYDRMTGIVHLGHPGQAHAAIYRYIDPEAWFDEKNRIRAGAINYTTGELSEYNTLLTDKEKAHVYNSLQQHLGVTPFEFKSKGWEDKFSNSATWDDDMTEEEELVRRDIRDPYATFDQTEPVRHINNPVPREHREDDFSEGTQGREAWGFEQEDSPVVFDGKRFYMGSPNSYHWDMIRHDPELAQHFDTSQYMLKNPLNATNPQSRAGLAYGRFNPASETTSWYHRGRFHPDKFDALVQQVWPGHYDESADMGYADPDDQWGNLFAKVGGGCLYELDNKESAVVRADVARGSMEREQVSARAAEEVELALEAARLVC